MRYLAFVLIILCSSCQPTETKLTAQQIVDKSILNSKLDKIAKAKLSFNFRNKLYTANRNEGVFTFTREFDSIKDVLDNYGFQRFVNEKKEDLADSMVTKYTNSVNSVHYFSVLPYGLNDKAVQKKRLPSSTVKGRDYYKIQISFSEDGGGEDFEDVFLYWIDKKTFLIDYLAYSYHTNGGGKRFRAIKKDTIVKGIRFVDFNNFKPTNKEMPLKNIDIAFEKNQLEKVSEIILTDIQVTLMK